MCGHVLLIEIESACVATMTLILEWY